MPSLRLPSTAAGTVDASLLGQPRPVRYGSPRTGLPGQALPTGWDAIPGARGCTPQSCSFRDHHAARAASGADASGLGTLSTDCQQELAARLELPLRS